MPPPETSALPRLRAALADIIDRWTPGQPDRATPLEALSFFRREAPMPPTTCLVETSIVLVVQGQKQMLVGGEAYPYDIHHFLVTSLDLPATSRVVEASPEAPCLGLTLRLDRRILTELIAQGGGGLPRLPHPQPPTQTPAQPHRGPGIAMGQVTPALLDPIKRLVDLLEEPAALPVLAPLITQEIHYRLLQSDQAARLWQITAEGSQGHRVARAIDWLRGNYTAPLRINELAARVQMSPSSLHHHFRRLTAMSPLQYQKWLRLNEARRLMLNHARDAASAAFEVGYESPSQFSREYTRLFGAPPRRHIDALRPPPGSEGGP